MAALVKVPLPRDAGEDSCNLLPVLLGGTARAPIREAIVHQSGEGTFGIRQGAWKLALALGSRFSEPRTIAPKPGEAEGQLYNLADDPQEQHNLWLQQPEIVAHDRRIGMLDVVVTQCGKSRFRPPSVPRPDRGNIAIDQLAHRLVTGAPREREDT